MKRFKVTISNPAGETYRYYWNIAQTYNFTGMPMIDLVIITSMQVTFDDGAYYKVEEDK